MQGGNAHLGVIIALATFSLALHRFSTTEAQP